MSHDNTCMKHLLASLTVCSLTIISGEVIAQDSADHVEHHAHEADEGEGHAEDMSEESEETTPALPEGMTLEETLQRAAKPPPSSFPEAIHDDKVKFFWLADQFEYRLDSQRERDVFGMEAMFWAGGDINRLPSSKRGSTRRPSSRAKPTSSTLACSRPSGAGKSASHTAIIGA